MLIQAIPPSIRHSLKRLVSGRTDYTVHIFLNANIKYWSYVLLPAYKYKLQVYHCNHDKGQHKNQRDTNCSLNNENIDTALQIISTSRYHLLHHSQKCSHTRKNYCLNNQAKYIHLKTFGKK